MKTKRTTKKPATFTVTMGHSYGCAEPQLRIAVTPDSHYRAIRAELFRVAAAGEAAMISSEEEGWIIGVKHASTFEGCVYLELADGTEEEAARGLRFLTRLAALAGVSGAIKA